MDFFDRVEELAWLKDCVGKPPGLVVVRGRRRVGKTSLILKALEKREFVYLYVDDKKNEAALLKEFEEIVKAALELPAYVKIDRWSYLYEILFTQGNGVIVVFDEFQRLLSVSPSAITQLQDSWDRLGVKSKSVIILSGSNVGLIKNIFMSSGAPLFKRATADVAVKPLSFLKAREILLGFGVSDFEEQLKVYAVIGGIPYYYFLLQHVEIKSWRDVVTHLFLNPASPLKSEVRDTMIESFGKDHASYYAVISAIAMGKAVKKEIADFSGILDSSLSPYLYDLEELVDIIGYSVPATEKKEWKSKLGRFFLKDNFFRFWFNFIYRNMSYFEEENYSFLLGKIEENFDSFMGLAFESVCREFLAMLNSSGRLEFKSAKIGKWWNRKGDEIDYLLFSEDNSSVALVECKWSGEVDSLKLVEEMKQKQLLLNTAAKNFYYVILARGFKTRSKECLCFDLNDLKKLAAQR